MQFIFLITNLSKGGGQRDVSLLSDAFVKMGHEVQIVLLGRKDTVDFYINEKIKIVQLDDWISLNPEDTFRIFLDKVQYKIKGMISRDKEYEALKYYYMRKATKLCHFISSSKISGPIYSFLAESNIVAGLARKKIHNKIIIKEGTFPNRDDYSVQFKNIRNRAYALADICVFQTEEQKGLFPKSIQKKSIVIPNMISENLLCLDLSVQRNKHIVNYGGYRAVKNLPLLIAAFTKVWQNHREYKLFLYGDGPDKGKLQKMIDAYKMQSNIIVNDFAHDIHNIVKGSAMFVMTSDFEGMPNSLIEAMAIGLPVISTDCDGGGAKAVIENGVNGLLVPKGDVDAVAAAMEDLIIHPEKAEYLARNAVKIREKLLVEKIAEEWIKILK